MSLPWGTLHGFAGATGIGAIIALGFYLILIKIRPNFHYSIDTYFKTAAWAIFVSISFLLLAYIIGLFAIQVSGCVSKICFGREPSNTINDIMVIASTKNSFISSNYLVLKQKSDILNGCFVAFLVLGSGIITHIKKPLKNHEKSKKNQGYLIACGIIISLFFAGFSLFLADQSKEQIKYLIKQIKDSSEKVVKK